MTLAAEAPDIDFIARYEGSVFYFAHHRGFTHSFLGLLLMSGLVVGIVYLFWRLRGRKTKDPNLPPQWGRLFVLAYIAGLSHILLDFTNNYGVRPFWPFSERWYSWDIVFIIEPILLILLLAGLIIPSLASLIHEEIGARQSGPKGRVAANAALAGMVILWGLRDYQHRNAVTALRANTYRDSTPIRVSAYPYMWNPFHWSGVIETQNFFGVVAVDSMTYSNDLEYRMKVHYKPEETPVTLAAKKSYLGRAYLDWGKYPITETEKLPAQQGYLVRFKDLRYDYPDTARPTPLGSRVHINDQLKVIGYSMGGGEDLEAPRN
jgi:inner membrane protein